MAVLLLLILFAARVASAACPAPGLVEHTPILGWPRLGIGVPATTYANEFCTLADNEEARRAQFGHFANRPTASVLLATKQYVVDDCFDANCTSGGATIRCVTTVRDDGTGWNVGPCDGTASLGPNSVTPDNVLTTGQAPGLCLTMATQNPDTWGWATCGGGGSSIILDLGDNGSNESTALSKIATSGDTNNVFTEPTADKLLINVANKWPTATAADGLSASCSGCVNMSTQVGTFTSATLAGRLTDETGTGVAVFGTSPTLTTPTISCTGCVTDANVVDTITASNYLPLAGGALTGDLTLSPDANEGLVGGGLGPSDCSNAVSSKVLWSSTTHKFSCGTDQGGGGGMTSFNVIGDSGTNPVIDNAANLTLAGSTGITTVGTAASDNVAFNFKYTGTLAGNPALNAKESVFSTDGTGGGVLFEGGTADTIEGLLQWSPTVGDQTLTLPDLGGAGSDFLVSRSSIDSVTNKTITGVTNAINLPSIVLTGIANNQMLVGTGAATGGYIGMPSGGAGGSCHATTEKTLYNTTTRAWSCATDRTGTFTAQGDAGTPQPITDGVTLTVSGGNGLTSTAGSGPQITVDLDAPVSIPNGGTNGITQQAAINNLAGLTTKGDILTRDASNTVRRAVGANGTCLIADSTDAVGWKWGSCGAGPGGGTWNLSDGSTSAPVDVGAGDTVVVSGGNGIDAVVTAGGATDTVALTTDSQEPGFLKDGGTTHFPVTGGNSGAMQVMDDGVLEWVDGAGTPHRRSAPQEKINLRDYATCDGSTDDTTAFSNALTAAAGKQLYIPSDCRVMVTGPSAGACKFTLTSGSSIVGGDGATILLGQNFCRTGTTVGAYCDATNPCLGGGTCSNLQFGPTSGSDYTLFCSAATSRDIAIVNVTIDAGQWEFDWGECVTQSVGLACNDASTTNPPGCASGGTCLVSAHNMSGDGNMIPIDLTNTQFGLVDGVAILSHRLGKSFLIGNQSTIRNSSNDRYSRTSAPGILLGINGVNLTSGVDVTNGIIAGSQSFVDSNRLNAATTVIQIGATSVAKNNQINQAPVQAADTPLTGIKFTGDAAVAMGNWVEAGTSIDVSGDYTVISGNTLSGFQRNNATDKSIGVFVQGSHGRIEDNRIWSAWNGVKVKPGIANVTIAGNRIAFGNATAIAASGSGILIFSNYLAWTGNTAGVAVVEVGVAETTGAAVNHLQVTGNLIHTSTSGVMGLKFIDVGKRCNVQASSPGYLTACTTSSNCACTQNSDCPGSTCGGSFCVAGTACTNSQHVNTLISTNNFLNSPATTSIDLSAITNNTTMDKISVLANRIDQATTGIAYPAAAVTSITGFDVMGNNFASGVTTKVGGLRKESYGQFVGNLPLDPKDVGYLLKTEVVTTGNTVAAQTIPIQASRTTQLITNCAGHRTAGGSAEDGGAFMFVSTYKNAAGTLTALGTANAALASQAVASWTAAHAISGANILVNVTSPSGVTANWMCSTEIKASAQ